MASKLNQLLSILLFLSILLNSPATTAPQTECPYPCYPPPTGTTGNVPPPPPPPPSQTGSYPPPAFYSPPTGYLPNYPPPPYFGNGAPAPPEPIVPWFPYYYRKPPHQPDQSSATALRGWIQKSAITLLVFVFCFLVF